MCFQQEQRQTVSETIVRKIRTASMPAWLTCLLLGGYVTMASIQQARAEEPIPDTGQTTFRNQPGPGPRKNLGRIRVVDGVGDL